MDDWVVWQTERRTDILIAHAARLTTLYVALSKSWLRVDEWSGWVDSSHEGARQISRIETHAGQSRVGAVHRVQLRVSAATCPSREDPARQRHWPAATDRRPAGMSFPAAATQRPQQVALETVVDETVDDWIHAAVAVAHSNILVTMEC